MLHVHEEVHTITLVTLTLSMGEVYTVTLVTIEILIFISTGNTCKCMYFVKPIQVHNPSWTGYWRLARQTYLNRLNLLH